MKYGLWRAAMTDGGSAMRAEETRNGLEDTKLCLDSIAAHTPEPHEVIVVDNGSTDGTIDHLFDHWIRGKGADDTTPRWSILRNVLSWTP